MNLIGQNVVDDAVTSLQQLKGGKIVQKKKKKPSKTNSKLSTVKFSTRLSSSPNVVQITPTITVKTVTHPTTPGPAS